MDKIDQKILSELSEDSSISIPRLAEKINVNSSVVYSRIKRLVKKKLIERFTIEVNNKEFGYGVKSLTGINMDSKQRDNIIQECHRTIGNSYASRSITYNSVIDHFSGGIADKDASHIITHIVKHNIVVQAGIPSQI